MWFLGALIGAVLGALAGHFTGMLLGALIGGLAAWAITSQNRAAQLAELERRLAALERAFADLRPAQPAPPPEPAPEMVAQEPAAQEIPEAPIVEPVAEAPRAAPAGPSLWERLFGGNVVVKVGVVVLFFGIAFLLKYTYERIHVPIELRLLGVALGAIVLLALGVGLIA